MPSLPTPQTGAVSTAPYPVENNHDPDQPSDPTAAPPQPASPTPDDFALREVPLPALQEGEVQVANQWLSVDPYMRGRMSEAKSYVPPFPLNGPLDGGAIGTVPGVPSPRLQGG